MPAPTINASAVPRLTCQKCRFDGASDLSRDGSTLLPSIRLRECVYRATLTTRKDKSRADI